MWWKLLAAAALFIAWSAFAVFLGRQWGQASSAARESSQTRKQLDAVLDGQKADKDRAEKLQKTLDRMPRPSNEIREVARENPSGCVLPPPVVGRVRQAIREGNSARKVP